MTTHRIYHLCLLIFVLCAMPACKSRLDKRVTLWRNDKIPYGTYYAYHTLDHLFKDASVERFNQTPEVLNYSGKNDALIIIGKSVWPSHDELNSMLNYVARGNYIFISSLNISQNLLDSFKLETSGSFSDDSMTVSLTHPLSEDSLGFTYPGFSLDKHFTKFDTSITNVLGWDDKGDPNFVSFSYEGGGAIFFHLAPTAFTNFFLLHKQNKKYYDLAMSRIPDTITRVRWDDYFRHHYNGRSDSATSGFSKLALFLSNPVLRWAFWLTILLLGIVYLFESKRKQRVIPYLKPIQNTSLDFVETIGRLYYQQKDNVNLFSKITAQFMGHVRHRYKLSSSEADEEMEKNLAYKSGYDPAEIKSMFDNMRQLEKQSGITDDQLLEFNKKIDKFYKQT